jgi:hypothetical protein
MMSVRLIGTAASAIFALLLLLGTGCGDGLRRASVKGQVLVDKAPLAEGSISFFPADGNQGPSTGGIIKNGQYSIPAAEGAIVGKNRVEIRGFRTTGKKVMDAFEKEKTIEERVPALAPEYNSTSELIRDVVEGANTIDFDLPGYKK